MSLAPAAADTSEFLSQSKNSETSKVGNPKEVYYRDEVHTRGGGGGVRVGVGGGGSLSRIKRPLGILDSSSYR